MSQGLARGQRGGGGAARAAAASSASPLRARRRTAASLLSLLLLVATPTPTASAASKQQQQQHDDDDANPPAPAILQITDANFDRLTARGSPPLVFSVGAAWCPHCVAVAPELEALARDGGSPKNGQKLRVGKVDGPSNRVLMMRLAVRGFPALFFYKDEKIWRYNGARTATALREFASRGHRRADPLPFHQSPVSALGRAMGRVFSLPAVVGAAYSQARADGWSDLSLLAGLLAVPVAVGGVVICALDAAHTRRARDEARRWGGHGHAD
jgi:thiol-disulfide isomerase/thioredoxin